MEAELGMAGRGAHQIPGFHIQMPIEARQDDLALRQGKKGLGQGRNGGNGRGCPGQDDGVGWWPLLPGCGLQL